MLRILHNPALLDHYFPIVTPLIPEKWHDLLEEAGCLEELSDVPLGIAYGFRAGVNIPILQSYIPPNHSSATEFDFAVQDAFQKEISAGRHSLPYDPAALESLIGPYRTSPLGVIEKEPGGGKFRIIQDHSFPRNDPSISSVNSQIDTSIFQCDWGTFANCYLLVANAPPGTEVIPIFYPNFCL